MNKQGGFTLIELLVVIAIIAILAAILFPVFISVKEKGYCAGCLSNLRQISTGFQGYVDDNSGWYPAPARDVNVTIMNSSQDRAVVSWDVAIFKYVKNTSLFRCPADKYARVDNTERIIGPVLPRSYTCNGQKGINKGWSQGEMKPQFSHYILLSEWLRHQNYYGTGKDAWNNFGGWDCSIGIGLIKTGLHLNGKVANYLFFDGHVKSIDPKIVNMESSKYWKYLSN